MEAALSDTDFVNQYCIRSRRLYAVVLWLLLAFPLPAALAESSSIPLRYKDGLPTVRIGIMGCEEQPVMDLILDTGASHTMIPYACLKKLEQAGKALELGSRAVVLANGSEQKVVEFLVDGLVLGGCEIRSTRVVCCKDPKLAFPPVLGMDTLQRLPNLTMQLAPDGGTLTFECPARPLDIDACGGDDPPREGEKGHLNYVLGEPPDHGLTRCSARQDRGE